MRFENKRQAAQQRRIAARFPNKRESVSSPIATTRDNGLIEAPQTLWDAFTWVYSAIFVGGMAATALYMLNIGVGQVPRWVMAATAALLAASFIIDMRVQRFRGIRVGLVVVAMSLVLNFFYTFADGGEADKVLQLASKMVVHMPLLGALLGLFGAYADLIAAREEKREHA